MGPALVSSGLTGRDLAFVRELVFGVVRRRKLLDFVVAGWMPRGLPRDAAALTALRIGVYEMAFMRTPAHAAVHEGVDLAPMRLRGMLNAVLRRVADSLVDRPASGPREVATPSGRSLVLRADLPDDVPARSAIVYSLPLFLVQRWYSRLGSALAEQVCEASVSVPGIFVRATLRAEGGLQQRLREAGVDVEATRDGDVFRWVGGGSLFETEAFTRGEFVVQDPTALAAARAVGAQPGETVVDYCAAPGTKTVLLAEAVGVDGVVWAWDEDQKRREAILANAERLRLPQVKVAQSRKQLPRDADRVLVDAPCSNTGVLTRRVEARERLTDRAIDRLARSQAQILRTAATHLRKGGELVYSTCSIEREENADVVDLVAPKLKLDAAEQKTTMPLASVCDGGFFARLREPG